MAPSTVSLEEVRSLTDQAMISRLLQEIIARERSIDAELEALLSKRSVLDSKVQSLADAEVVLESVAVDSEKVRAETFVRLCVVLSWSRVLNQAWRLQVAASVTTASTIAEKVSSKVKELDLAQGRVQETINRINTIVDRANCINGVSAALQSGDFEAAAEYVETFERVSSGSSAKITGQSGGEEQRESIATSKKELTEIIRSRFSQAAEKSDHTQVLRFARLFKPLGLREEGLKHFTSYLRAAVGGRAREDYNALSDAMAASTGQDSAVDFVGTVTNLFKDLAVAVEENEEFIQSAFGGNALEEAIAQLQQECDQRGVQLLKRFTEFRRIPQLLAQVREGSSDSVAPRQVEVFLEEMLMFSQRNEEYVNFMLGKLLASNSGGPGESPGRRIKNRSLENLFRASEFSKKIQEIVSHYIMLEEFFMVENVKLAISIDEHSTDSLTSSVVDDTFFILQKCARRAVATANVQCACAALNHVNILLSNQYLQALRNKAEQAIRQYNQACSTTNQATGGAAPDISISAIALNNMDVSADYAHKLRVELESVCGDVFTAPNDREKIKMCLGELAESSASFKQATSNELDSLSLSFIQKVKSSLETIGSLNYDMSEDEYAQVEMNDPWVQPLMYTVDMILDGLPMLLSPNMYDSLVHLLVDFVVSRVEALVMHKRFNQLGGLQFDREIRYAFQK